MTTWRDTILQEFVPDVSKLTLVADPDSLLTEEILDLELRQRGFDLIEFSDPVEFRYAYESQYRSIWDRGEYTDLVVILRLNDADLKSLPYDLLRAGRQLSFNLGDLFPNLSYPVVERLDRSFLDSLFDAQLRSPPDRMGDNATKDFILRYVYGIAAELIFTEVELLRALLRIHYNAMHISSALASRLITALNAREGFKAWPLDEIVPDAEAFLAFLQERWPLFLKSRIKSYQVKDGPPTGRLQYRGPELLPFDHHDIRVFIDNMFVEGKLDAVDVSDEHTETDPWILSGISVADTNNDEVRAARLFGLLEDVLPTADFRHADWTAFALKWAELSSLVHCGRNVASQTRLQKIGDLMNGTFADWLSDHYASLINLPPNNPVMLHHVPRRLARDIEGVEDARAAVIVVDGLSMDQWVTIRQILQKQDSDLVIRESGVYAWIPTLTSVSRQAIFSGKAPFYFPSSINTTNSEEKLWKRFWEAHGLSRLDVVYKRALDDGDATSVLDLLVNPGQTKVVGLVVDMVDKIMHGMQLGSAGMHNQIKQWCRGGFLSELIGGLLDDGYDVWLTSDHGNIECEGKGRPSEGVIAETRGERVRIYPTPELRAQVAESFTFGKEWSPVGLPEKYFPLIAGGRDAFVNPGTSVVGHGGIAIEEVIVPLVKFERRPG